MFFFIVDFFSVPPCSPRRRRLRRRESPQGTCQAQCSRWGPCSVVAQWRTRTSPWQWSWEWSCRRSRPWLGSGGTGWIFSWSERIFSWSERVFFGPERWSCHRPWIYCQPARYHHSQNWSASAPPSSSACTEEHPCASASSSSCTCWQALRCTCKLRTWLAYYVFHIQQTIFRICFMVHIMVHISKNQWKSFVFVTNALCYTKTFVIDDYQSLTKESFNCSIHL